MSSEIPAHDERPYGFMERELAFKLLASHALVDPEFFEALRTNPVLAAGTLHIKLTDADEYYLRHQVDWEAFSGDSTFSLEGAREALHLDLVTNSW